MTHLGMVPVLQYCLFAASGRLPSLVWMKENMLGAFLSLFFFTLKYYKCCLLLQVVLPGLIDTLLHSCQLEIFSMNVFDADVKVFNTEIFRQDTLLI